MRLVCHTESKASNPRQAQGAQGSMLHFRISPPARPPTHVPCIRFQLVLEKILALIRAAHLEVICMQPLRPALDLMPTIHHFLDFDPLLLPLKPPRRLIRLVACVTLNLNGNKLHTLTVSPQSKGCQLWRFLDRWTAKPAPPGCVRFDHSTCPNKHEPPQVASEQKSSPTPCSHDAH